MTMTEKAPLGRVAPLRIAAVETAKDVEKLQKDMLRRLKESSVDPDRYAGLADCGPDHCGRVNCLEACWFGTRRRRENEIAAIRRLLQPESETLHEVRAVHGVRCCLMGDLDKVSIAAAKQVNRHALDKLYNPDAIAVGTFKVSVNTHGGMGDVWVFEIHQIVAGCDKASLEKAFASPRIGKFISNTVSIKTVEDLDQTISNVLRRDLEIWRPQGQDPAPSRGQRLEFYKWLLSLDVRARLIRYGCDHYFNKLAKQPRLFEVKPRKPRPYPYHLKKYMYGAREDHGEDKYDLSDSDPDDVLKTNATRNLDRKKNLRLGLRKRR
jgi:hypothetical protein